MADMEIAWTKTFTEKKRFYKWASAPALITIIYNLIIEESSAQWTAGWVPSIEYSADQLEHLTMTLPNTVNRCLAYALLLGHCPTTPVGGTRGLGL